MASVSLCPTAGAFAQFFTTGGLPLNAGLLYQYGAGGTTPTATYTTSAGSVQNANPIVLGADGRPPNEIWLVNGTAYRFDLYDSASNLIATYDNVSGIQASSSGSFLPLAGGTMTGDIAMSGTQKLTGLAAGTTNGDSTRYEQSPSGLLTAKGGLISASAANTPVMVSLGAAGTIPMSRTAATTGLAYTAALNKYIYGLTYDNGTDATNDININTGGAMDATGAYFMVLGTALGKQSDVAWSVGGTTGSPAGWLDTGAVGNNDYYIWLICRSDTGVVDSLCSLSSTAPTMPANYDFKKLIGWFRRTGGTVVAFTTYEIEGGGLEMDWTTPTVDINSSSLTTSRLSSAVKVPQNFSTIADLRVYLTDAGGALVIIQCPDETDAAPSVSATPLVDLVLQAGVQQAFRIKIRTSATGLIATRASAAVDTYIVLTVGFRWARRN